MSKITFNKISAPENVSLINDNFQKIADEFDKKVLYRSVPVQEPNQMVNPLDMNGNRVYNLPAPAADHEAARLEDVKNHNVGGQYRNTLRTPEPVTVLPNVAGRKGRLLSFDSAGKPVATFPANDSSIQLRIDLASGSGIGLIGAFSSSSELREYVGASQKVMLGASQWERVEDPLAVDDDLYTIISASGVVWKKQLPTPVVYIKDILTPGMDNSEELRKAFTYATKNRFRISFEGVTSCIVQANAQISFNTSIDFANTKFTILNGLRPDPLVWAGGFDTLFILDDPTTPLRTISSGFTAENMVPGNSTPFQGAYDGAGYTVVSSSGLKVPSRDRLSTINYIQAFYTQRAGEVSFPLSVNLSENPAAVTLTVRDDPDDYVHVSNIRIDDDNTWNKFRFLWVTRNSVVLDGIRLNYTTQSGRSNICQLIHLESVANIKIQNVLCPGLPYFNISGTYILQIDGGANIHLNNVIAKGGWGWIGTNIVSGLFVTDSVVNRIDGHSSLFNVFVNNTRFTEQGLCYGWGGGVFQLTNCFSHGVAMILLRNDYGGTFYGDFIISNAEVYNDRTNYTQSYLINFTNGIGATSFVQMPRSINASNITFIDYGTTHDRTGRLIDCVVWSGATASIRAPQRVSFSNINMEGNLSAFVRLPTGSMVSSTIFASAITLSNINGSAQTQVTFNTGVVEPTTAFVPSFVARGVPALVLNAGTVPLQQVYVSDSGIAGLTVKDGPDVQISNCRINNPNPYSLKFGGVFTSFTNCTKVFNSTIVGMWDLSGISASSGNLCLGSAAQTLPAGATKLSLFTGFTTLVT